MQANSFDAQTYCSADSGFVTDSEAVVNHAEVETVGSVHEPTYFHGYYSSCMEMGADAKTVSAYLDAHQGWFRRCAQPMSVEPLGENGYALTIGRFGSFGYEVEPKIGLDLLPQQEGIYRIETIAIPGYEPVGYEVDFKASLHLVETTTSAGTPLTRVEWELNLDVAVQFPRFIRALPQSLIQKTGDRLLNQVVRQVSRCLTHKVQSDFHATHNLPFAHKTTHTLFFRRGGVPDVEVS
jgi:hypothetical protein